MPFIQRQNFDVQSEVTGTANIYTIRNKRYATMHNPIPRRNNAVFSEKVLPIA
jgi:hypothetical protein